MDVLRLLRLWCGLSALAAASIVLSVMFLDAPVARFFGHAIDLSALRQIAPSPRQIIMSLLASHQIIMVLVAGGAALGLFCILERRFPLWAEAILLSAVAAATSASLTLRFIKPVFARPNPRLFVDHLRTHFGWHNQGIAFGAFPSTHAALLAAALAVLGLYFPRARITCIFGVIAIEILLIAGSWHFVSDVLAGNILGFTTAVIVCAAMATLKGQQHRFVR